MGHARFGEKRNVYKVLVLRPEGKVPLERPRHRLKDNFKIDVREIVSEGLDSIQLRSLR
jgi:hypothetical protein